MKDRLGKLLCNWRVKTVLPWVHGKLLDIGCGTNEVVQRHGDGVGVDVYPWTGVDVVVENTAELPFEPGEFDTVSIVAALNHIPNREAVLTESHRVLRPGGRILLTMIPPHLSRVWHWLRRPWDADQAERGMQQGELYGLTKRNVDALLRSAGFEVETHRRFMALVNCLTVAIKPE